MKQYIEKIIDKLIKWAQEFENDVHMDNMSNDEYLSSIVNSYKSSS